VLVKYFPDSHQLNHRVIVASFEEKGSHTGQAIRNDGFFMSINKLEDLHQLFFQNWVFQKKCNTLSLLK
jgi:hypothetical protein